MPDFTLQPFAGQATAGLSLSGTIERRENVIALSFVLAGDLEALAIPAPNNPDRADDLWQATCFEMFWAAEAKENYWELNLAPTGNWNVYAFSGYRRGMRREEGIACPSFDATRGPAHFVLSTHLDLSGLHHGRPPLKVGLCAVLKEKSNRLTYWALAHPGEKPDFHAAAGFAIRLP